MTRATQPDIDRAYALYAGICNKRWGDDAEGVWNRVNAVRELERLTGEDFKTTAEFHRYISEYLVKTPVPSTHPTTKTPQKPSSCDLGVSHDTNAGVADEFLERCRCCGFLALATDIEPLTGWARTCCPSGAK